MSAALYEKQGTAREVLVVGEMPDPNPPRGTCARGRRPFSRIAGVPPSSGATPGLPIPREVTRVVRTIVQSQPDLIFNFLVGDTNLFYTRLLRAAAIMPEEVPTVYFSVGEIELQSLSTREIVGDFAAWNYFQGLDRPENQVFVDKFRSRYGRHRVIADPMEAAYLGVHLWAQAVEAAGNAHVPAIRQALRNQSFEAPGGTSGLTRRINTPGRRCDWDGSLKEGNSKLCGAPKSRSARNLIPVHVLPPPGTLSWLNYTGVGVGAGLNRTAPVSQSDGIQGRVGSGAGDGD
jgi:hypothetical protein